MMLSELVNMPIPGPDAGRCYLCGRQTDRGHQRSPSDSFTAWALCYDGEVICEFCFGMIRNHSFRTSSWMATRDGVQFIQDGEIFPLLLDPPEPPFVLYIAPWRRGHAWIALMRYVSQSRERFWIGLERTDAPILASRQQIQNYVDLLEPMASRDIPLSLFRSVILLADPPAPYKYIQQAIEEGWIEQFQRARALAGNLLWEVVCYAFGKYARASSQVIERNLPQYPVVQDANQQTLG